MLLLFSIANITRFRFGDITIQVTSCNFMFMSTDTTTSISNHRELISFYEKIHEDIYTHINTFITIYIYMYEMYTCNMYEIHSSYVQTVKRSRK